MTTELLKRVKAERVERTAGEQRERIRMPKKAEEDERSVG
jgi:hypothetical protein